MLELELEKGPRKCVFHTKQKQGKCNENWSSNTLKNAPLLSNYLSRLKQNDEKCPATRFACSNFARSTSKITWNFQMFCSVNPSGELVKRNSA